MQPKKILPETLLNQIDKIQIFMEGCAVLLLTVINGEGRKPEEEIRAKINEFAWLYLVLIVQVYELAHCQLVGGNEKDCELFEEQIKKGFNILFRIQKFFAHLENVGSRVLGDLILLIKNARDRYPASKHEEHLNNLLAQLNCMLSRTQGVEGEDCSDSLFD
jgi:hypothetical protein